MLREIWFNVPDAGGSAPEAAPAGDAGGGNNSLGISKEIETIFNFDPFNQPASPAAPPSQAAPAAPADGGGGTGPAAAPPSTTPTPDEVAALAAKAVGLEGQLQGMREAMQAPQTAQPAPQGPQLPQYSYEIPDQLLVQFSSENPLERKAALVQMAAGISANTHQRVVEQLRTEFAQVLQNYVGAQINEYQQRQTVLNDYYSKFPTHRNDAIRPLIAQAFQAVNTRYGGKAGWNDRVRDEVGDMVNNVIRSVAGSVAAPQPQPQAPTLMTPGAAPRPTHQPNGIGDQIAEMALFGIN